MTIKLLYNTPLWVCSTAIRKCWASEDKSDSQRYDDLYSDQREWVECGDKDKALIERIGNKNKHSSTLEHLVYTFDIDGISRACLQELARHRIASYSVKSTRYTLKELKDINLGVHNMYNFLVSTTIYSLDIINLEALYDIQDILKEGASNDKVKYLLPEAYKTSLVMTINARSLQNFLELRTSKSALWEIRDLAKAMYDVLPEEHKYLFLDSINFENVGD